MAGLTFAALGLAAGALVAAPLAREALRRPVQNCRGGETYADTPLGAVRYDWAWPEGRSEDGPVVVLIHGLTTPSFVWGGPSGALITALTGAGFRVLTYDLFGRGLSDRPKGRQDPDFFCRQLLALLDALAVTGPLHVTGYSMGAVIAAKFAAEHAGRTASLSLIAAAGMGHDLGSVALAGQRLPALGDWLFHLGYPVILRRGIRAEASLPGAIPDLGAMQRAEIDRRGYIGAVLSSLRHTLDVPAEAIHRRVAAQGTPVSAIWAGQDRVIPLAGREILSRWNPAVNHRLVTGAGHGLVYTHADAVAGGLLGSLRP